MQRHCLKTSYFASGQHCFYHQHHQRIIIIIMSGVTNNTGLLQDELETDKRVIFMS